VNRANDGFDWRMSDSLEMPGLRLVRWTLMAAVAAAAGCAQYEPMALNTQTVEQRLKVPPADQLQVEANQIRHPLLRPVQIGDGRGLTPDQAAVLAVLLNPALRTLRDQRVAAAAQAMSAGILPNPQLTFSEDFPNGGTDAHTLNAFGLGVNWDVTALITRDAKINAAAANRASVDLDIAWQEWQVAQAAKTAVYDLLALQGQLDEAREVDRTLTENARVVRDAVNRNEKTVLDLAAAQAASDDAHTAALQAERDVNHQRLALLRAIGLPPDAQVRLSPDLALPSRLAIPSRQDLLSGLEDRRLDLVALRKGYQSQEETLRAAVLAQFPKINIGFNKARDNTNVHSLGFGITVDLPIFDQNQGVIAAEKATRQRLFDEYAQRVYEANSDVATALDDIDAIQIQIDAGEASVLSLQRLVDTYRSALQRGNVDVLSYYTAVGNLEQKRSAVLKLKQQLIENQIALELATGEYLQAPQTQSTTRAATPRAATPSAATSRAATTEESR